MAQQKTGSDEAFDGLCEKIASGKASAKEIAAAFELMNNDLSQFEATIHKQLKNFPTPP